MFEQIEWVKKVINMRDDKIVIPLYVQIYGEKYSLLKLDTIKKRFSPSAFKIGYGTADALFMENSFPVDRIHDFDIVTVFTEYDNQQERTIRYLVFESGDIDLSESDDNDKLSHEISEYFGMLYDRVKNIVDEYFKSLITENVPFIPREPDPIPDAHIDDTHDDETIEPTEPDILYATRDDEYYTDDTTDDIDEEDALEELRREVSEYSQDDKDGYPRVTEGGLIGKETVDFINGEGEYSDDNEDYSTDFDIF